MIEFSHVSKLFGAQKAVNDLNLNFQEGSFSVLIGTSGSGKSTTLKMINRLVEHDSGEIRFAGEEIRSLPVLELRRRMGYAIQSIGLFPTGAWRKTSLPCRNYKNGRGHGLTIVSTN
ncbi:ABC transporter ATP-binding protein [Escherichia coli]|uniref:ABC transporter ATP-binding protein n=1 Tax=Escherichia coli TaxID=562 RepID=A0A376TCT4_ECOLX|nr:ABC transporter ATP-binding protein [Escherichia coli]